MGKEKSKNRRASTVVTIILVMLLLGGAVGGIVYATNGGTTALRLIDVTYDGKPVDNALFVLRNDETPLKFTVKSKAGADIPIITVRAYPSNNAKNVTIVIGDKKENLFNVKEFTGLFNISRNGDEISIASDWNLENFLSEYFLAESIELDGFRHGDNIDYITLVFTIGEINIKCNLVEFVVQTSVELDKTEILF